MDASSLKPLPPALPDTADKFRALRKLKAERTLNDQIEDIFLGLADNEDFTRFLYAVWDEQAVEGSLSADNLEAAHLIREKAKKIGYVEVAKEKKATIAKALGVVLRRYGTSRQERRNMVDGQTVSGNNGD